MFRPIRFLIARFCLNVCLNLKPCARMRKQFSIQPCASCAQCAPEMPPEAADLSAHVSTARTQTARGCGINNRISIPGRAVQLCHTAKGPAQGAFGLRWSPVPPVPRRDINSERRSLSFLISLREGMDKSSSATGEPVMLISKGAVFRFILRRAASGSRSYTRSFRRRSSWRR